MSTLGGEGVVDREAWLKNSFEFAYVTQFLNFFYPAFGLDSFSYHVGRPKWARGFL